MNSVFSLRIVSVDSTINKPIPSLDACYSNFKQSRVSRVPVIRVFGSTPAGQTTCLNIHGVFPYLMVPYSGPKLSTDKTFVEQYLQQMAASLDQALSAAANMSNNYIQEHVYDISLLRATPFYGYHDVEQLFIKIYFYYPSDIKRANELLQAGAVMNHSFQPHEGHIPYILQMLMDYNLYGMNLLHSKSCWFRKPVGKVNEFMIVPRIASVQKVQESGNLNAGKLQTSEGAENINCSQQFSWDKLRKAEVNSESILEDDKKTSFSQARSCASSNSTPTKSTASCNQSCVALLCRTLSNSRADELMSTFHCEEGEETLSSPCPLHTVWNSDVIPSGAYVPPELVSKQTTCEIEADILAADILNREELIASTGKNPGLASIWADEKARRRARRESSLIESHSHEESRCVEITEREQGYLEVLKEILLKDFDTSINDVEQHLEGSVHSFLEEVPNIVLSQTQHYETTDRSSISPVVDMSIVSQVISPSGFDPPGQPSDQLCDSFLNDLIELDTVERETNHSLIGSQRSNGIIENDSDEEGDGSNLLQDNEQNLTTAMERDESYVMSQPWESGIEDFLVDSREEEDVIPQLDGKSDDVPDADSSSSKGKTKLKKIFPTLSNTTRDFHSSVQEQDETIPNTPPDEIISMTRITRKSLKIHKKTKRQKSDDYCVEQGEVKCDVTAWGSSTPKVIKVSNPVRQSDEEGVLKVQTSPPTWMDAEDFMKKSDLASAVCSEEPFYSKMADVQPYSSSRLLTTLPIDTKSVRFSTPWQRLKEFNSNEFKSGIQHWKLVSSAMFDTVEPLKAGRNQDNFDPFKVVVIKPSQLPPSPAKVWNWIEAKKMKQTSTLSGHKLHGKIPRANCEKTPTSVSKVTQTREFQTKKNNQNDASEPETTVDTGASVSSSRRRRSKEEDISLHESVLSGEASIQHVASTLVGSAGGTEHSLKRNILSGQETKGSTNDSQDTLPGDDLETKMRTTPTSSRIKDESCGSESQNLTLQSMDNHDEAPYISRIVGPTRNSYGFRASQQDLGESKALHEIQHVTTMSMELHVKTRLDFLPDPEIDPIRAAFYAVQRDSNKNQIETGVFVVELKTDVADSSLHKYGVTTLPAVFVDSEQDLFNHMSTLITKHDPDILLGYEVQMLSWGYLLSRASQLGYDLCRYISRVPSDQKNNWCSAERDIFGADNASEIHITGRVVLNLWRLMRTEVALYDYKFESVAYHLLHQRYPHHSHKTLTLWFDQPQSSISNRFHQNHSRSRLIDYFMCRVLGNLKLISQQDIIGRTSELARLFGIQFYEVLTRGSQYRVESMMLRLAHSLNYAAVSPGTTQRAMMKAPECIPLVMEPESRFYAEPVIVVDFQSLYPSIIIAHNYCFSTCLGRVEHLKSAGSFPFGCTSLNISPKKLRQFLKEDAITVAPNAVAYVKASARRGVLPAMLEEILNTRIMVKESMKKCDEKATKQMLDHRQLGLKLIANVTYGYTSASYSGRMPCVEIADSIVNKSRETLERAIRLVNANHERWQSRVVYGDTDSMFIALKKGTSKQRAFQVGREIVDAVTNSNPPPMKLKFEKVYYPCVLQTKKRYVGYAYESEDQKEPIFDAKGIETVRRDGCPAVAKILEQSLKILFDTRDVSEVKSYVENQCRKILDGKSTLQDCTIAREYRGMKYYKPGVLIPALILTRKMVAADRRSEPRLGERVPYVVVHDAPGTPLYQLIRHPKEVLLSPHLRLNGAYYATKMVLPALDRVMSLLGVDVSLWYHNLPREVKLANDVMADDQLPKETSKVKKATLSQYFGSRHCLSCKEVATESICSNCRHSTSKCQECVVKLMNEIWYLEKKYHRLGQICLTCANAVSTNDIKCESMDCPILYKLMRSQHGLTRCQSLRSVLAAYDLLSL